MLFNSFKYLIFLPISFLIYWFLCPGVKTKNLFLVIASYVFYSFWNIKFLFLIIFITIVSYLAGKYIYVEKIKRRKRLILYLTLLTDFGILFIFKYFNFFTQSFINVLQSIGFTPDIPTLNIILPVGISFYTFQGASYVIDIYRRTHHPTNDILSFFAFISFFPQLVAGPIERATNLLPQFQTPRNPLNYERGLSGMKLILWGLFKKMIVADNAAVIVNQIFLNWENEGTLNLWIGAFLFSFQIYGDFSGYSDIAIGTARLFGIDLIRNFDKPYLSKNISQFWGKWHISLSGWFRDYLYIPLGGNRYGKCRTIRNTTIVFILSGLWHGANFTYLLWGAYHAILYIPHRLKTQGENDKHLTLVSETFYMGLTFLCVMIGWVIFRAESVTNALLYIKCMFSGYLPSDFIQGKMAISWCIIMLIMEVLTRKFETPLNLPNIGVLKLKSVKWIYLLMFFMVTLIFSGQSEEFIYFQF